MVFTARKDADTKTNPRQRTNISTTPLWQCLPFSCTTLRGKHCRHPIAVMGVVDMFEQCVAALPTPTEARLKYPRQNKRFQEFL